MIDDERFNAHRAECQRCGPTLADLCQIGQRLALEMGAGPVVPTSWDERFKKLARYRVLDYKNIFQVPGPCGRELRIVATPGEISPERWDHVSVSVSNRCPNWEEMCFAKSLFWDDEVAVMELHPPKSTWVNNHPHCLHLWRPLDQAIPLPPEVAVGRKEWNL